MWSCPWPRCLFFRNYSETYASLRNLQFKFLCRGLSYFLCSVSCFGRQLSSWEEHGNQHMWSECSLRLPGMFVDIWELCLPRASWLASFSDDIDQRLSPIHRVLPSPSADPAGSWQRLRIWNVASSCAARESESHGANGGHLASAHSCKL